MKKWLSFIIPVYNVEEYLSECIGSLLDQNIPLDQYEIIIFDDGSMDNSLQIALDFEARYPTVRVFTHANSGAAQTRNEAIEKAKGEYIWFVDSDDFIASNLLQILYDKLENETVDMLIFNNMAFEEGRCRRFVGFDVPESVAKKGVDLYRDFYYNPVLTNRLIRRDLLVKNKLRYIPGNKAEDCVLNPLCFYHANAVCSTSIDAYYYRMRSESVSHNVNNQKKIISSLLEGLEYHVNYMKGHLSPRFWMKVFVHDIRRVHIWLDTVACTSEERNQFVSREKTALRSSLKQLPFSVSVDYSILCITSISPQSIMNLQRFLRKTKQLIKR